MLILITENQLIAGICIIALLCILMYAAGVQMGRRHPVKKNTPESTL
jgi:hypothetical protein